jgi:hypothetical protein
VVVMVEMRSAHKILIRVLVDLGIDMRVMLEWIFGKWVWRV